MKKRLFAAALALLLLTVPALADFNDVPSDAWYYEAVNWAQSEGLMDGVAEGTFDPGGTVTRAMVVTILYRLSGEPDMPESDWGYAYADVDSSAWYAVPVYWARLNGVADGVSDTQFNPTGSITREQLVTMLWRYAGSPAAEGDLTAWSDGASVSDWAADAVTWAVENGLLTGSDTGALNPQGNASRAELATLMVRASALLTADAE